MNIKKKLTKRLRRGSGRDSRGRVVVRHHGGGSIQRLRQIDWRRDKQGISGIVEAIEYDPLRSGKIALIKYLDGERRFILCPEGLQVGETVVSGSQAEAKTGNNLPLIAIPVGTPIHNLELTPQKGGQIVRGAGAQAVILAKENGFANVRLPSGEVRKILLQCFATIGQVSNIERKNLKLKKAGQNRWRGIRPTVRGVAQNPRSHPHGGGEARSGIGMPSPKSPWGKPTLGKRTRNRKKYSNSLILKRRRE